MPTIHQVHALKKLKEDKHGFITSEDLPDVIEYNRLYPCLVRCGSRRFTCPAQDVEHFVAIIDASPADYVRDVSML